MGLTFGHGSLQQFRAAIINAGLPAPEVILLAYRARTMAMKRHVDVELSGLQAKPQEKRQPNLHRACCDDCAPPPSNSYYEGLI